jgi:hypothetical protein
VHHTLSPPSGAEVLHLHPLYDFMTEQIPFYLSSCPTLNILYIITIYNKVPRRIFGPKRDEVTGEWRKLNDEELHDLYSSPSIIRIITARRMRWAGHITRMGERRNAYGLLVGKPEGRRPLGRPRRRWLDNIGMDLVEVGWSDVNWIGLAQDRGRRRAFVNSVLNLRVILKCWETIECPNN